MIQNLGILGRWGMSFETRVAAFGTDLNIKVVAAFCFGNIFGTGTGTETSNQMLMEEIPFNAMFHTGLITFKVLGCYVAPTLLVDGVSTCVSFQHLHMQLH
jgi:hypothetical protein